MMQDADMVGWRHLKADMAWLEMVLERGARGIHDVHMTKLCLVWNACKLVAARTRCGRNEGVHLDQVDRGEERNKESPPSFMV